MLAFYFLEFNMDIHTAALYMGHGYRIRHAGWVAGCYLYKEGLSIKVNYVQTYGGGVSFKSQGDWRPILFELTSDGWELILDGIVEDFGTIKYED